MEGRARALEVLHELRTGGRPVILAVEHGWGGGVERHLRDLDHALRGRAVMLRLQPAGPDHVALRLPDRAWLWFHRRRDWTALCTVLEAVGIDRVHFHHVHGLPEAILELPARLGCPHRLTLHDYYPACPAYHLKDASLRFCGGEPSCRRCLDGRRAQWPMSIDEWRARFASLLASAERVIAPSQDAAARLRAFFPAVSPAVWPHPSAADAPAAAQVRVLVPGAISVEKGLDVLEACVADARARDLPLHFHVVGFLGRALPVWPEAPLTVSGQYEEGRLPQLLSRERGDVFFFPAQVPETFSYTLSAALATGKPVVATNLGALPERLAGRADARVLAWDSSPRHLNDALLAACPPASPGTVRVEDDAAAYADRYLEGLARAAVQGEAPHLEAAWLSEPRLESPRSTLAWLYDDGVVAGKASSREELRRRAAEADAEAARAAARCAELQAALDAETARARQIRTELAAAESARQDAQAGAVAAHLRLRSLQSSRSWRLLGPVRAVARWLRLTRS